MIGLFTTSYKGTQLNITHACAVNTHTFACWTFNWVNLGHNGRVVENRVRMHWRKLNAIHNCVTPEWVSEWLRLTAFWGTDDIEVHVLHTSCVIIAYTPESLSSLTAATLNKQNVNNKPLHYRPFVRKSTGFLVIARAEVQNNQH